jgi:hypothetical protein
MQVLIHRFLKKEGFHVRIVVTNSSSSDIHVLENSVCADSHHRL